MKNLHKNKKIKLVLDANGMRRVKIEPNNMAKQNVRFPPILTDNQPPGTYFMDDFT